MRARHLFGVKKEQKWLDSLKPGDPVVVKQSGAGRFLMRMVRKNVDAIHKLHIVVGSKKFKRAGGWEAGNRSAYDRWYLVEPTPELNDQIDRREALNFIRKYLANAPDSIPTKVLQGMVELIKRGS